MAEAPKPRGLEISSCDKDCLPAVSRSENDATSAAISWVNESSNPTSLTMTFSHDILQSLLSACLSLLLPAGQYFRPASVSLSVTLWQRYESTGKFERQSRCTQC